MRHSLLVSQTDLKSLGTTAGGVQTTRRRAAAHSCALRVCFSCKKQFCEQIPADPPSLLAARSSSSHPQLLAAPAAQPAASSRLARVEPLQLHVHELAEALRPLPALRPPGRLLQPAAVLQVSGAAPKPLRNGGAAR